MRHYINGFTYGERYFKSVGHFTEKEWNRMIDGEVIVKNGNEFWIEVR